MLRKFLLLSLFLLISSASAAPAQSGGGCAGLVGTQEYVPFDEETITVSSTAVTLTSATFKPTADANNWAMMAFISVEDADIRFYVSGATPTSSSGHLVTDGNSFTLCGLTALENYKAIRTASTNVKQTVTYFKVQ